MALRSPVCDLLGINYPILLAGMGGAATPELAAAVSNAGGLGVLGAAACGPNELRAWIRRIRSLTDRPFGVDTLLPASVRREASRAGGGDNAGLSPADLLPEHRRFARDFLTREGLAEPTAYTREMDPEDRAGPRPLTAAFFEAQMEVVIEERVPLYAAGLGSPAPWIERLKSNGTKVMCVVGATKHARQVLEIGVDLIVAQGHDGGGHNSPIGTMALIPQVVDEVRGRVPVLGAGGIADGRGIAAAMMLGAQGVWIGTAFLATEEAGLPAHQKQALLAADDRSTVVSRAVTGKPARMLRNKWADAYADTDIEPLPMPWQSAVAFPVLAAATSAQRADIWPGFAGQGLGMVRAIRPAAAVLHDLVAEAEAALIRGRTFLS